MSVDEGYSCDTQSCPPAVLASRTGDIASLKNLLQNGESVVVRDIRGWTPLHEAARHNHYECLTEILKCSESSIKESFINMITLEEETAIVLAARHGHVESVRILIEHRADLLNKSYNGVPYGIIRQGYTALWEAVFSSNVECVKLVLEAELEPENEMQGIINRKTCDGETPLHLAAKKGLCDVTMLLLAHGARLDVFDGNNLCPIFVAAQKGYCDCLKILVEAAKSRGQCSLINELGYDQSTPLYMAAHNGCTDCVRLLLENGADPNLTAEAYELLPVHAALSAAIDGSNYECLDMLLPVTLPSSTNGIRLDLTCMTRLKILRNQGINFVEYFEGTGKIPIDWMDKIAIQSNFLPKLDEPPFSYNHLSAVGISVSCDSHVLKCAVMDDLDHRWFTRFLLESGSSPDPHSVMEAPPILAAVYANSGERLKLLLEHGADVHVKHQNFLGDVAFTCAAGISPPASSLLLLFLYGASADSCFGRASRGGNPEPDVVANHKWSIQDLLFKYSSPSMLYHFVRHLISLCWNPQLDPRLEEVIRSFPDNSDRWKELQDLAAECSTLKHLCRRQIFKTMTQKKTLAYQDQALKSFQLPSTLIEYLFYSTVGLCYHELACSLDCESMM